LCSPQATQTFSRSGVCSLGLFHTTAQVAEARHALAEQIAGLSFSLTSPVCSLAPLGVGGDSHKPNPYSELQMPLPVGLVYDPASKVVLDPDTGVQQAIRHLFSLFARTGSARAVVQQFNADGLLFPVRVRTGAHKGELAWMPLQHWRVLRTLHNPRYAGAFAYGRRRERLAANGKKSYQLVPREQWIALIRDAHPGYIGWDQYETNQKLLLGNAAAHGADRAAGPAREGTALLQGLRSAIDSLDERRDVRVVVVRGAGPAFCSGMDLKEMERRGGETDPEGNVVEVLRRVEASRRARVSLS